MCWWVPLDFNVGEVNGNCFWCAGMFICDMLVLVQILLHMSKCKWMEINGNQWKSIHISSMGDYCIEPKLIGTSRFCEGSSTSQCEPYIFLAVVRPWYSFLFLKGGLKSYDSDEMSIKMFTLVFKMFEVNVPIIFSHPQLILVRWVSFHKQSPGVDSGLTFVHHSQNDAHR